MFLTFVPRLIFIIITIWEAIDNSEKQLVIWVLMACNLLHGCTPRLSVIIS